MELEHLLIDLCQGVYARDAQHKPTVTAFDLDGLERDIAFERARHFWEIFAHLDHYPRLKREGNEDVSEYCTRVRALLEELSETEREQVHCCLTIFLQRVQAIVKIEGMWLEFLKTQDGALEEMHELVRKKRKTKI